MPGIALAASVIDMLCNSDFEQAVKDKEQILQSYNTLQNKIGKRQEVMATLSLEVKNAQGIIENSILEVIYTSIITIICKLY